MKNTPLTNILLILLIILILCVLVVFIAMKYNEPKAIEVEKDFLHSILKPGVYKGSAVYSPTKLYPSGLETTNELMIRENKKEDSYDYVNKLTAVNRSTGEVAYHGIRKGKYFYKPHHGKEVFLMAKSYINDKIVSSQYGVATRQSDNSLSFTMDSSWHIDEKEHKNASKVLTRSGNKLHIEMVHPSYWGMSELTLNEIYEEVQ